MSVAEDFRRYASLLEGLVRPVSFAAEAENAASVQVERAAVYAQLLLKSPPDDRLDRLFDVARSGRFESIAIVDRTGHHRPVYRGLMIYSALQSFRLAYETIPREQFGRWEEGLRGWCDRLEFELNEMEWNESAATAARGAGATEAVWMALALHLAGKVFIRDAWTDLAADLFGKLSRAQQPEGAFLMARPADNPETRWYHELVILHAAASYAAQAEDRHVAAAVQRNTMFQMNESQPDHATSQPWALLAFIWNPEARTLADQMLHTVRTQHPSGPDGVTLILLADALHGVRLFVP